jgi:hypothetical protein
MSRKIQGWLFVAVAVGLVGHAAWSWFTAGKIETLSLLLLPGPLVGAERLLWHGPIQPGVRQ